MEMGTDVSVWFSCTSSGEYHVDPDVTAAFTNGRLAGVLIPSAHTGYRKQIYASVNQLLRCVCGLRVPFEVLPPFTNTARNYASMFWHRDEPKHWNRLHSCRDGQLKPMPLLPPAT